MIATFKAMLADRRGASLVEYAVIALLIAVVGIAALTILGHYAASSLSSASTSI